MSTKMLNLLQLICHCDPIGIQIISKIFHNQLIVRTLLAKLIVSSKRHDFELNIIFSNRKVAQSLKKRFEYIDKIRELLSDFHLLLKEYYDEDNYKFKELLNVFMSKTTVSSEQSDRMTEEFFGREQTVVDSRALAHMHEDLKARSGVGLLDVEATIQLLKHMDTIEAKFADRLVSLIVLLSKCYSDYFTDQRVIETVLSLPHIILVNIATDSVIKCVNWSQSIKDSVIETANARQSPPQEEHEKSSESGSESISQVSDLSDFMRMQDSDPFQENLIHVTIDLNQDNN